MAKRLTYQAAYNEMQEILEQMENDALDVDELSAKVKRVSYLHDFCSKKLRKTQADIEDILHAIDAPDDTDNDDSL